MYSYYDAMLQGIKNPIDLANFYTLQERNHNTASKIDSITTRISENNGNLKTIKQGNYNSDTAVSSGHNISHVNYNMQQYSGKNLVKNKGGYYSFITTKDGNVKIVYTGNDGQKVNIQMNPLDVLDLLKRLKGQIENIKNDYYE